jgi:hypothetical protein
MIAASSSAHALSLANQFLPDPFDIHHQCLDMIPIKWSVSGRGDHCSESGILLEIWRMGGLFQTGVPIPTGSQVELAPSGRTVQAQVTSCEKDDYGFLVHVSVDPQGNWFPQSFCPRYLRCEAQELVV